MLALLAVENRKHNSTLASNKFQDLYSRYFGNRLRHVLPEVESRTSFCQVGLRFFFSLSREAYNTLLSN